STYTPMTMVHATVAPTAEVRVPWRRDFNALVYVLAGRGSVGPKSQPLQTGQLAVLGSGDEIVVSAATRPGGSSSLEVVLLGGQAIAEPVAWGGPFVMNTRAEVLQAFEDFQRGRLGQIPSVHALGSEIRSGLN
ncbi:MAG: pirin family protein, partial [Nocardioidaceae bacterium]|nr:pirin family protein [Nocardioidaceae bacterium]